MKDAHDADAVGIDSIGDCRTPLESNRAYPSGEVVPLSAALGKMPECNAEGFDAVRVGLGRRWSGMVAT